MQIKVTQNEVKINKDILNDGEYNIHKCQFDFGEEYKGLVQKAVFTLNDDTPYLMTIVNNECNIPIEVLEEGVLKIGVYAYETNNDELVLRYSPSPDIIHVFDGSYVKDAQNTEPITPTDKEQIEEAITNLQNDVNDLEENKQDTLVSGENIKTINGESVLGSGNIEIDLSNYYNKQEIDQSQASQNANISKNADDIATLNNNLTNYSLITETGSQIALNVNSSNYQMTAILKDKNGNTIYTSNIIDLPIESMIVNVTYDSTTKEIVFTLQNGTTLRVSVADLVSGLVSTDDLNTILANYYTKTEIDTLLSAKANSNDVYTKSEADTLLGGKVETTTYTQGQATQDANIEENKTNINWLQTLVNQMPTVSGQGTDISLQDVYNYRLIKFLPQGNSSQESTTGKQLLNNANYIGGSSHDVTATIENDEIILNGTANATAQINIMSNENAITLEAGTYTLSANNLVATGSQSSTIRLVYTSGSVVSGSSCSLGSINATNTFTLTESITCKLQVRIENGEILTNFKVKPMLELGSEASPYEPYTGGVPAPNPSYPYPVKTVTGENSLVINSANLFDKDSGFRLGYINTSGTFVSATATACFNQYIPCQPNTNYTISFNKNISSLGAPVYYTINKTFLTRETALSSVSKRTFTTPENCYYIVIQFNADGSTMTQEKIDGLECQLVKGSTAPTTYVEHEEQNYQLSLGNIELNSSPDGTIRDQIVGKPNEWYKREYIGKVVLDGSETYTSMGWSSSEKYGYRTSINDLKIITSTNEKANIRSNYFTVASANGLFALTVPNYGISARVNQSEIIIRNDDTTTVNDFKTWLSTHNTIVWYQKSQYTDIPITDTTLISQLNNIYNNAHSYNGVTNITTTYEDGNEQMYLDIEALKNVWEVTE